MKGICTVVPIILLLIGPLAETAAAKAPTPCKYSPRYVMPKGIALPPEGDGASAPADLPGSRSGYHLPKTIDLYLGSNPLGTRYSESALDLGHVEIDPKTGDSTIDGKRFGGDPDLAACASPPAAKH